MNDRLRRRSAPAFSCLFALITIFCLLSSSPAFSQTPYPTWSPTPQPTYLPPCTPSYTPVYTPPPLPSPTWYEPSPTPAWTTLPPTTAPAPSAGPTFTAAPSATPLRTPTYAPPSPSPTHPAFTPPPSATPPPTPPANTPTPTSNQCRDLYERFNALVAIYGEVSEQLAGLNSRISQTPPPPPERLRELQNQIALLQFQLLSISSELQELSEQLGRCPDGSPEIPPEVSPPAIVIDTPTQPSPEDCANYQKQIDDAKNKINENNEKILELWTEVFTLEDELEELRAKQPPATPDQIMELQARIIEKRSAIYRLQMENAGLDTAIAFYEHMLNSCPGGAPGGSPPAPPPLEGGEPGEESGEEPGGGGSSGDPSGIA